VGDRYAVKCGVNPDWATSMVRSLF